MMPLDTIDHHYKQFASHLSGLLLQLEEDNPAQGSIEWSFLNHIRHLAQNSASSGSFKEIRVSLESLNRFAVDSMPWEGRVWQQYNELISFVPSKFDQRVGVK